MNRLRKALVASVMFTTIFTMSAVLAPGVSAAASAGDLIKMDGLSSVYYLAGDNKRYVFPNENTYFSWYSDFAGVKVIPQSELETYSLGKNVTIRPGTKLVKITTDPKVYAVLPNGQLKWLPSEAVASALYGTMWNKRIIDVSDAFFTNYTIASGQLVETAYPAGQLIKLPTAADVYFIDADGKARKIMTEAAFLGNRFKWADIVTTATGFTLPTAGTDITGAESAIIDTSSGAGGQAGAGSGLTVALSGDTPASRNVPSGAALVPFLVVNVTAASDGDVTVDSMTFTRKGTGVTADFDGGYLYSGDTRLSTKRSVNSSDHTITFTALNLKVAAGTTKAITLRMTINTGDKTGNHYFELVNASSVLTNGAVVSGSFPIAGNTMSLSAVDAATILLASSKDAVDRKIGETNVVLGEFTIQNQSSTEDTNVYRIRLKQEETAADDAVKNISLDLDGTVVMSGVNIVDKYIDFVLETPFLLKKSKTITATIRGDVVEGIGKKVQFYLNNVSDFEARGTAFGDFYSTAVSGFTTDTGDEITIKGSEINVSFDGPQAADVKDDTDNLVLANFKVKTSNTDVNIETMRVQITYSAKKSQQLINVEMVDSANNASYSASDAASSSVESFDFENVYLKAGTQYNFAIRADVPDATVAGETFYAKIDFTGNFTARFQDANETAVVPATDMSTTVLTGKTMTIAAPSIDFAKVTTSDATYVKNALGVLLYKGKITANSVDNLKVSKVKFEGDTGSLGNIDTAFSKLYFNKINADGSETTLNTLTSLGGTTASFSGFTIEVLKGTSNGVYVVVRGDVKDSPTAGTISFNWIAYGSSDYTIRDSDSNDVTTVGVSTSDGQTTTIATAGAFTMTFDSTESGTNAPKNILAGTQVLVGRLKFTASKEPAKIEDFTLYNLLGTATQDDVAFLKLYGESGMTTLLGTANLDSSRRAMFEDVNIEIPTSGTKYVYVAATLKPIDYSLSPGADSTGSAPETIKLDIASTTGYIVKALGVNTGEVLDNVGVASTTQTILSTTMGATMSNITTSFANALLGDGIKDIFSFKVTAPASSNIDYDGTALGFKLATTTFTVASSSGITISGLKVRRVGGTNGEQTAVFNGVNTATFTIGFQNTYLALTDLIVRPGETAEYIVSATIAGSSGTGKSLQLTIESVDTAGVQYTHNTNGGTPGADGVDTAAVYPLLPGITSVRGGSLTN